jgi:hypothetical protein
MPDFCECDNEQRKFSSQDKRSTAFQEGLCFMKNAKNIWFEGGEIMLLVKLWSDFGPSDHLRQQLEHTVEPVKYKLTLLVRLKLNTGSASHCMQHQGSVSTSQLDTSTARVAFLRLVTEGR